MFEDFKARHGGLGPLQSLLDYGTHGYLSSRIQAKAVGAEMDDTAAAIAGDSNLTPEFKDNAAELLRHGVFDIPTALRNVAGLRAEVQAQTQIRDSFAPVIAGAKKLLDNATDPDQRDTLSTLLSSADAASKLARDPATRQQGLSMFGTVAENVNKFTTQQRADDIAAQVRDEQIHRELDNTQFSRWQSIAKDHATESAPFAQVRQGYQAVQVLAQQTPTPQTDQALMMAALRVINPNVIVRAGTDPGDDYWNALPGGIGQLAKYVVTGGAGMTQSDRQTLLNVVQARAVQENTAQAERNTRATNQAGAADLPPKYVSQLALPLIPLDSQAPAAKPGTWELVTGNNGDPNQPAPTLPPAAQAGKNLSARAREFVAGLTGYADREAKLKALDAGAVQLSPEAEQELAALGGPARLKQLLGIKPTMTPTAAGVYHSNFGNDRGVYVPQLLRNAVNATDEY